MWLPIINPKQPQVPQLRVQLTAVGGELRAAHVAVAPLAPAYLARHGNLVQVLTSAAYFYGFCACTPTRSMAQGRAAH